MLSAAPALGYQQRQRSASRGQCRTRGREGEKGVSTRRGAPVVVAARKKNTPEQKGMEEASILNIPNISKPISPLTNLILKLIINYYY